MSELLQLGAQHATGVVCAALAVAALAWYVWFARVPIDRLPEPAQIRDLLIQLPGRQGDILVERGSISRFELWRIRRRYDQYVLRQLGIKSFNEANGMASEAEPSAQFRLR